MDIGKSFTYMFEEDRWVEKLLIGGLLCLIPIVNFFAIGYALRALKNVSEGKHPALPEWDEWGADWVKGLVASFVAPLIYAVPLLFASVPFIIVSSVTSSGYSSYGYYGYSSGTTLGTFCGLAFTCLALLWGLFIAVVYPAGMVKYAHNGQFGSFFRFGEIFRYIKNNLSNYIVAILLSIVASIAASIVGGIACGIGVAFTSFWASLVMAHLFGQVEPAVAAPIAPAAPVAPAAPTVLGPAYGELETNKLNPPADDVLGGEPPKES